MNFGLKSNRGSNFELREEQSACSRVIEDNDEIEDA